MIWAAANRGLRLGLILLVTWLSLSTARSIYQLLRPATSTAKIDPPVMDAPPPADLLNRLPAEGYWTFNDFPWRLARREVSAESPLLADPTEQREAIGPSTSHEQAFLASLEVLANHRTLQSSGASLYRLPGQFPIEITTQEIQGEPRLLSATIALPSSQASDKGRQTLLQLSPKNVGDDSPLRASHLLPLPAESLRTFARWTNADELLLEFVETPRTLQVLLAGWRAAGWEIHLAPGRTGVGGSYLCANGGRLIIVYVQQAGEQSTSLLLASHLESKR